jgi:large subunit ribosomal protein L23
LAQLINNRPLTHSNSWEHEGWEKAELWQKEQQDKENPKRNAGEEPDHKLRAAYKEQAKALLEKKETWRPTWKAVGLEPHEAAKKASYFPASTLPAWYAKQRKGGAK